MSKKNRFTKKFSLFVSSFVVCVILSIASCTYIGDGLPRQETLIALLEFNVVNLDPIDTNDYDTSTVLCEIYEGLLKYDDDMRVIPSLAERWEVTDDVLYTFYLKRGVYFHNGEELKASDVKFSLERAIASEAMGYLFEKIEKESLKIVDDYTISLSTKMPSPTLPMVLCHTAAYIVSEKATVKKGGERSTLTLKPVGTGPFKFEKLSKDELILSRFDAYYGALPYFKFIQFQINDSYHERIEKLQRGEADIICSVSVFELAECGENSNVSVHSIPSFGMEYLGFNVKMAPLDDVRVRRAIAKGIDVDLINQATSRGFYQTATAPVPYNVPYSIAHKRAAEKRDVEGAKALLLEAGYRDGLSLNFMIAQSYERMIIASKIKEQLWRIGINLEVEVLEWSDFLKKMGEGEAQMFLLGGTADLPDCDSILRDTFYSASSYQTGNYTAFADDELDALLDEASVTLDEGKRASLYERAQDRIIEMKPVVFIYYDRINIALQRYFEGVKMSPLGFHFLAYIKPKLQPSD